MAETTTVDAVRNHLDRDPPLTEVLLRDLLRLRRTARWLIDEHGWDTTEEAVVSALRRYADEREEAPLARPRSLPTNRVDARGGFALLAVPPMFEMRKKILHAWESGELRDLQAVLPSRRYLRLVVEAPRERNVRAELGLQDVEAVRKPLTVLTLASDGTQADKTVATPALTALTHAGIEVVEILSSGAECSFLVPDDQRMRAFDVLSGLTSSPASP